jgi:superfamily II DNA or RNA helicase
MSKPERFTAQQVADAVYEAKGLASIAARRLGVSATTVRKYAAKHPSVKEAILQAREDLKDFAESKLLTRIDAEDMTAIIFYLKTQAKDRGYVERQEVNATVETRDLTQLSDDDLRRIAEGKRTT